MELTFMQSLALGAGYIAVGMAAIGSTLNINSFIINLFIGLSVGTNVLTARYAGADDNDRISRIVHTSMLLVMGLAEAPCMPSSAKTWLGLTWKMPSDRSAL